MKKCLSFLGLILTFLFMIYPRADALELDLGSITIPSIVELPERFWPLPPVTEEEDDSDEILVLPEEVRRRLEEELRPRIPGLRDRLTDLFPLPDDDGDGVPDPLDPEEGVPPPPVLPSDPTSPEGSGSPTTGPARAPTPAAPADSFSDGGTVPLVPAEGGCSLSARSLSPSAACFWMIGTFVAGVLVWRRRRKFM